MIANKIKCKDEVERLMTQCVKHEGEWISTQQWLDETENNTLPLHEPLKSHISNKIATGQLKTIKTQSNTVNNTR